MLREDNIPQRPRRASLDPSKRKKLLYGCAILALATIGLGVKVESAAWFWSEPSANTLTSQFRASEPTRRVSLSSKALSNPTYPDAPAPGSTYFRALPFDELVDGDNATPGTRAAYELLLRTNNGDAVAAEAQFDGRARGGFDEYERAVFLNTVADIQRLDVRLLDNAVFTAFYYGDKKDAALPFGIILTGVTTQQLDRAKMNYAGVLGLFGRRSPRRDSVAALEATPEMDGTDKFAFDVDLYNLKSDPDKHMAEVNFNLTNTVTTHPADVSRALQLRGILSGVITG